MYVVTLIEEISTQAMYLVSICNVISICITIIRYMYPLMSVVAEDKRSDILSLLLFSFKKLSLFNAVLKVLVIR